MESESILDDSMKTDEVKATREDYIEIEIPYNVYQYLSTDHCNVQNMCRICLATDNEILYPLLATKENNVLAHMLTTLTTLQLLPEDGLPTSICEPCQALLVQSYEFKIKCEKSDCMLKSILKGEFITKEEIPDHSMEIKNEENLEDYNKREYNINLNNEVIDVKQEADMLEDVQYLEDLSDISDSGNLCVVTKPKNRIKYVDDENDKNYESKGLLKPLKKKLKKKYGNKENTFTCKTCSKKFQNAKSFHAHMKSKHPNSQRLYSCNLCTESFNSDHDLKVHASIHSKGNPWKCNQCPKEFSARAMLRRHISRHMESKRFSCEVCSKAFTEQYALRRHARVHTGEIIEKKHACTMCDKRYSDSGLLAAHMSRHIGLRPCECSVCGKRFPSNRLLASHRLVHSDRKPYACQYCDKRFRHESTRNTHHRTHTGEKPYVCSVCGKSFIQNSNLTLHMRTHTGERPYSCSTCGRKFTSGSTLKTHERIHSGERPFSCEMCGKSFSRKNLSAHMRKHTGERPYECGVCSKKFANATRLRDHHRVHTGEKPFDCSLCTLKFATKSQQLKHSKTHLKKKRAHQQASDKDRDRDKHELIILQHVEPVPVITDRIMFNKEHGELITVNENVLADELPEDEAKELTLNIAQEVPLDVTGELVLQDDSNIKTELLVVDNSQMNNFQSDNICLNTNNVNIIDEGNFDGDMNLVTVNEGEVSISTANLEGTTVKLYQLDQSLVQIHSSGGQVTISKITSKMTANF
ncbi:hypothetical protein PYW08_002307 [Mythimna loreyi]|uniref:Uncharacterized protein n=1 Tax=Mythimna loreyi TaxID=667449 RepID=A0ACC2R3R9_9NEOP|nr:hypothetical protein PYW08_002307 [Mythimna loreyi]